MSSRRAKRARADRKPPKRKRRGIESRADQMTRRVAPERPAPPVSLRERRVANRSLDDAELFLARASKKNATSAADVCAAAKRHQRGRSGRSRSVRSPRIRGRSRCRLHVVVRLNFERLAPTDALLPQLIERAHRHGARHPLQPPHATRLDVDDQTHPSLQQQLPREPSHRSLHHEDVRADGVYPGHRPAQVLVLLVQQRVQRREPRRRVGALVFQRPPQEDDSNVPVANRGHPLVRHVLGEHLPARRHHPALVDAPARDLLAPHVRARVHPTPRAIEKNLANRRRARRAPRRSSPAPRRAGSTRLRPKRPTRRSRRVARARPWTRPRSTRPGRLPFIFERSSSRRFVPVVPLGLGRVHSVGSRSASRTARLARSDTAGGRRPRRARRPPRARHGDGGDGGGDGGGRLAPKPAAGSIVVEERVRRGRFRHPPRVPLPLLLLLLLLLLVVVVGFRGWNGVAVGPSPRRVPVPSGRSQELRGGARRVVRRAPAAFDVGSRFSIVRTVGAAAFAGESARDDDEPPTLSPPSPTGAGAGVEAPFSAESSPRRDSKQKSHTLDGSTPSSRMSTSERGRWSERELHAPQNTLPHARQWCLNPGSDPGNSRSHP